MNKEITLVGLTILTWGILLVVFGFSTAAQAEPPSKAGCTRCHATLTTIIPKDHPRIEVKEIQSCMTCHSAKGPAAAFERVIHWDHYQGKAFTGDCFSCHQLDKGGQLHVAEISEAKGTAATLEQMAKMAPYFRSWASSKYLDHRHGQKKKTCLDCHETYFPTKGVTVETCFKCHGSYGKVASLTEKVKPNPHASHLGNLSCSLCHKAHRASELHCNQCHEFDLKVP